MQLAASASKICIRVSNFCFRVAICGYLIQSSRVCTRLATSTICMPLAATRVQFVCESMLPEQLFLNEKMKTPLNKNNLRIYLTLY
jgi:hypothetical protein